MKTVRLDLPQFGFIVATRAALGAGIGLLVSNRLTRPQRTAIGTSLIAVGAATTIPAAFFLRRSLRNGTAGGRQRIPRQSWQRELDSFTRQHEGWAVSITTQSPSGSIAVAAHDVPLQGVILASQASRDIAIITGSGLTHWGHEVRNPASIELEMTGDQAERALIIHGSDGVTTTVALRTPMRAREVDGLPFSHAQ